MSNMSLKEFIAIVQAKIEEEPDPGRLEGLRKGERGTSTVYCVWVSLSVQAPIRITTAWRLTNNRNTFLTALGAGTCKIQVPAWSGLMSFLAVSSHSGWARDISGPFP